MYLDPELAAIAPTLPRQDFVDIPGCREVSRQLKEPFDRTGYSGLHFEDVTIARPDGSTVSAMVISDPATRSEAPVLMNIHGGGFCLGDPEFDEGENAEIVARTGVTVVSPNYRLAPEFPFPAGFDDCCVTLRWIADGGLEWAPAGRSLAVMGHSAGGGLAAAVALWARDVSRIELAAQFLLEPELDPRLRTASITQMTDTPVWFHSNAVLSWQYYLAGQEPTQFSAAALAETLAGLPRTYLVVNQADPLRDEGLEYASRLMADDVPTEIHCWPGAFHGFMAVPSRLTRRATDHLVEAIGEYLPDAD